MKASKVIYTAAAVVGSIAGVASAQSPNRLLLVGAIESVNSQTQTIRVLGHDIRVSDAGAHSVGHLVSVYGSTGTVMQISAIANSRVFATGSETVLLSGTVSRANSSTGVIKVDGVSVDITPLLATSAFSMPGQGSTVSILGTQPSQGGIVLAASLARGLGVTSGGQAIGVTSGGQAIGVTSGGQAIGVTSGGQVIGVTSGGQAIGVTSGGQAIGVTSGGQAIGVTSGGQAIGVTSGGQSVATTNGKRAI